MKNTVLAAAFLAFSLPAFAEALAIAPQPVEITAVKSLEWNRKAKTYTARENVIITQGVMRLQSDTATAHYNDVDGITDISTVEADGSVVISSPPYVATGDHAVYDVKSGNAVLTGKNLSITMGEDVLTAGEKIEFFSKENKLVASGAATTTHGGYTLMADSLTAYFIRDAEGQMIADKVTGQGHVSIKSAKETATGDNGVYDVRGQKAWLTGKVKILQGPNWLEGIRADVDMVTGISRLSGTGAVESEGRVKGVFYPKTIEDEKPEGQKQ